MGHFNPKGKTIQKFGAKKPCSPFLIWKIHLVLNFTQRNASSIKMYPFFGHAKFACNLPSNLPQKFTLAYQHTHTHMQKDALTLLYRNLVHLMRYYCFCITTTPTAKQLNYKTLVHYKSWSFTTCTHCFLITCNTLYIIFYKNQGISVFLIFR